MHISTLAELLNGTLLNTSVITAVESIAFVLKDVRRGSLFFAKEPDEVSVALALGAYCVVFDCPIQTTNTDSALIKVNSIENATLRYLRYFLLNKNPQIYLVSKIELAIIKALSKDGSVKCRDADLSVFAKELCEMGSGDVFVSDKKDELEIIYKEYNTASGDEDVEILKEGIFGVELVFFGRFYKLNISSLFLPELKNVLSILKDKKIKDEPIFELPYFRPLFVNKHLKTVQNSDIVLIIEEDDDVFLRGIEFLDAKASYAKRVYFCPFMGKLQGIFQRRFSLRLHGKGACVPPCGLEFASKREVISTKLQNGNIIFYQTQSEIFDILRTHRFNFVLILKDKTFGLHPFSAYTSYQPTLF